MKRTILVTVCLLGILLTGCGGGVPHPYENKKADDAISRAIYEAMGEELYYLNKSVTSDNVIGYRYLFYEEREGQLLTLQTVVNTVIQQEEITGKIAITCCVIPPGDRGSAPVVSLSNYDDAGKETAEYAALQKLWIRRTNFDTMYDDPSAYKGLPDIKYLEICSDMAAVAQREKIDWYEYFPELETLKVFEKEN